MRNRNLYSILMAASAILPCGAALAESLAVKTAPAPAQVRAAGRRMRPNNGERLFMRTVAHGNMAEIRLGRLALNRAGSSEVRSFAQKMIDDHGRAQSELKSLAARYRIVLPANVNAKQRATYDRLARLRGASFDRAYMREMVADHRKTVTLFMDRANTGRNSEVREWAAEKLPALRHHLAMARETRSDVQTTHAQHR
jgi:putative membrane protein